VANHAQVFSIAEIPFGPGRGLQTPAAMVAIHMWSDKALTLEDLRLRGYMFDAYYAIYGFTPVSE
jgi:hypothetical protein